MTDIEKLKGIIDEIDVLIEHKVKDSTPEFKTWHHKAERFVYHHFSSDSPEYKNFLKLFIPCVRTLNSDNLEIAHLKRELTAAKGIFQNYLSELCEDVVENDEVFDPEKIDKKLRIITFEQDNMLFNLQKGINKKRH